MRIRSSDHYFVYITSNPGKTVLYTGMTNDLKLRLNQHYMNRGKEEHFASKYYCYKLMYYEMYDSPSEAIHREKNIKDLNREKKIELIKTKNPGMSFLVI